MLRSDINVTPLVDVCLVLLIIFMVVTPMMVNGPVQLPQVANGTGLDERALPLTVKQDGSVYLGTAVIRREELSSQLERMRATEGSRPIHVRADKQVLYGDVRDVLGACRDAGWEDVTLVGQRENTLVANR
jgi:biopolymer transport protein ExbD